MARHSSTDSRRRRAIAATTAVVTGAATALALAVPLAAHAEPEETVLVRGGDTTVAGLLLKQLDCEELAPTVPAAAPLSNVLDDATSFGQRVASFTSPGGATATGVVVSIPDPSSLTELSVWASSETTPISGAAVVEYADSRRGSTWTGTSLIQNFAEGWQQLQAQGLTYSWREVKDGAVVGTAPDQTISAFLQGRGDGSGATVGFVFGCNGVDFLLDGLGVVTKTISQRVDFEGAVPTVKAKPQDKSIRFGRRASLVTHVDDGTRPGRDAVEVAVEGRLGSAAPEVLSQARVDVGKDRVTFRPVHNGRYRVRVIGGDDLEPAVSRWVKIKVGSAVSVDPRTTRVRRGKSLVADVALRPESNLAEALLQVRDGSGWRTVERRSPTASRFTMRLPTGKAGSFTYRVFSPSNALNASGSSPHFTVRVMPPPKQDDGGSTGGGDTGGGGGGTGGGGGGGGGGGEDPPDGPQRPTA